MGISRYTGRVGVSRAVSIASCTSGHANWAFVTGLNIPAWSVHSCRTPRCWPGRRSVVGMSVATTSTGEPLAQASPVAASVFAAPGPVVTSATPSCPVARAKPSAA